MQSIEVLHKPTENEPFAVVVKPSGLPSAPLNEGEDCAYTQAAVLFPELNNVAGKRKAIEHGLLHRIDNDTQGLLLIASSQEFYDHMENLQQRNLFVKHYKAVCEYLKADDTYPEFEAGDVLKESEFVLESRFRAFGLNSREVRPVTETSGRAALKKAGTEVYSTSIKIYKRDSNMFEANCTLTKGYRHQVRSHLAWMGFPIVGDSLYNPGGSQMKFLFAATGIEFTDPDGKKWEFSYTPDF